MLMWDNNRNTKGSWGHSDWLSGIPTKVNDYSGPYL